MTEPIDSYLLPCTCGRSLVVRPQQAGETLRCECGLERSAPTMVEIRRLQPATQRETRPSLASGSRWGVPQRLLLSGVVMLILAGVLAAVLAYGQHVYNQRIKELIEGRTQFAHGLGPWGSILWFRQQLAPGIDIPVESQFSQQRQMLGVGMVFATAAGVIGAVLAGLGIVRILNK